MRLKTHQWSGILAALAAALYLLTMALIVIARINYRYELEWMEGASLVQVNRILAGKPIYEQASFSFIPLIYPPFYFYLSALVTRILGLSFLPLRLVSFGSTLGCLALIHLMVKQKTASLRAGLIAAGSFAAAFRLGGAWFDIARVDMLFLFLCLAGVYALGKQSTRSAILAGMLLSLAFATKQTALAIFAAMAVSALIYFRRQFIPLVTAFLVLTGLTYFFLNRTTNGWYQYFVFTLPATEQIRWSYTLTALLRGFGLEWVVLVVSFLPGFLGLRKVLRDNLHSYYYLTGLAMLGTAVLGRIDRGAYDNAYLPAYAGLAILFGLGIGWLVARFDGENPGHRLIQTGLWLVIVVQFFQLRYNPIQQIPTLSDRQAGDALLAQIQNSPGNVLIPYHNYLALLAGKQPYFHFVAFDELRGRFSRQKPQVQEILQQFNSTSFDLIILDLPDKLLQKTDCQTTQNLEYPSDSTFYPVTGYQVRPTIISSNCP